MVFIEQGNNNKNNDNINTFPIKPLSENELHLSNNNNTNNNNLQPRIESLNNNHNINTNPSQSFLNNDLDVISIINNTQTDRILSNNTTNINNNKKIIDNINGQNINQNPLNYRYEPRGNKNIKFQFVAKNYGLSTLRNLFFVGIYLYYRYGRDHCLKLFLPTNKYSNSLVSLIQYYWYLMLYICQIWFVVLLCIYCVMLLFICISSLSSFDNNNTFQHTDIENNQQDNNNNNNNNDIEIDLNLSHITTTYRKALREEDEEVKKGICKNEEAINQKMKKFKKNFNKLVKENNTKGANQYIMIVSKNIKDTITFLNENSEMQQNDIKYIVLYDNHLTDIQNFLRINKKNLTIL